MSLPEYEHEWQRELDALRADLARARGLLERAMHLMRRLVGDEKPPADFPSVDDFDDDYRAFLAAGGPPPWDHPHCGDPECYCATTDELVEPPAPFPPPGWHITKREGDVVTIAADEYAPGHITEARPAPAPDECWACKWVQAGPLPLPHTCARATLAGPSAPAPRCTCDAWLKTPAATNAHAPDCPLTKP